MKKQKNIISAIYTCVVLLFSVSIIAQTTNSAPQCTNPVITSLLPVTGPAGTSVTITGSGFQAGAGISSVKFGGVSAASFTVISDTSLRAVVPANGNNGSISVTTETCTGTGGNFTVIYSNCSTSSTSGTEIYISELYDQKTGSGGMVELYNPTNNPIVLTGTYVLQRYGNISDDTPTAGYILNVTGTIDPESTFLVAGSVPNPALCIAPPNNNNNSFVSGFNDNDKIELLKNGLRIDIVNTPATQPGFTMIRKPDAIAPAAVYNSNDWNITLHNDTTPNNYCDNLGSHGTAPIPAPTITMQPVNTPVCPGGDSFFEINISAPAGFTYQWKILNAAGNWVNVTNNANYSGANTNKLILNDIPASFEGNQYYCVATQGTCVLISNVVQLSLLTTPAAPVAVVTQPTCTTPATITVTPVAGVTYSIDGVNYQAGNIFNNVAANTYNITVKNAAGCVSPAVTVTVNPAPGAPAAPVAVVTQPTCTTPATITVTPVAGVTYSIDGVNYQSSNIFNNVAANTYNVTVKNAAGCVSPAISVTVNLAPGAPAAPVAVVTQPTCTSAAIITVTPVAGVTYSIDGVNYQSSNIFNNVAANTYNVTVKNAAGCVSTAVSVTVNPVPGAPAAPVAVVTQPTCTTPATITITPVAGVTYSIDGTNYQASNIFNNVAANTYNVTVKNAAGCVSTAVTVTVNTTPGAPAAPVAVVTQPTCTTPATITVTPVAGVTYSIDGLNYQAGNIFNNVAANTYNITVKNAAGCVSPAVSVTVNPVPGAPAAPVAVVTQPTCTSAAIITVTPVAGVTYSIDGVNYQASNIFNNVAANTYNVTVKNAAGCVSTAVTVTVNTTPGAPAAPVAVVTQPTCTTPATITVTPAGVTYSIDGVNYQASNIFNNVAANTYSVTVKNAAGCVSPAVSVTVNPAPGAPAAPVVVVTQSTCTTPAIITVTPVVGVTYSIDGTNYQASNVFNNVAANTYNVTVKNAAGCVSIAVTVTVNTTPGAPAAPVAVVTQPTCTTPATITVTPVAGVTYSIDGVNYQSSNIFNNVAANTYNVTVKNAAGCVSTAVTVTVNTTPGAPAAPVAAVTQPTCTTPATIIVTPVVGVTYSIDGVNYQSSNIFNNVAANTYSVTVKNAAGCVSTAVTVTVNTTPGVPAAPVAVVTQSTCTTPAIITVTPVAGVTYSIDGTNYQSSNIFNNVAANTYNVTVKNAAGCVSSAVIVIVNPGTGVIPEIGSTEGCRETISGRKYILEALPLNNTFDVATSTFEWRDVSGQLLSSGENTFNATEYIQENDVQFPLTISVKVITNGGCSNTFNFILDGIFCDIPRGISPNNDTKNDSFNLAGLNVSRLLIYNRYGKEVYSRNNYVNEWYGQGSNDDELPTGTYYYIIETTATSKTGWVYINREN